MDRVIGECLSGDVCSSGIDVENADSDAVSLGFDKLNDVEQIVCIDIGLI